MHIYCVKCRRKVYVPSVKSVVLKAGRSRVKMRAWEGRCRTCGSMCYRFIGRA